MAVPKETLLKIYRDMVRCKVFEEKHVELLQQGKTIVGWHWARGEEGLCAIYSQLRPDDFCGYTHRVFYPWLCKGIPTRAIFAESMGKVTGTSKGKGGTHISGMDVGIFGRSGMQGGHFPIYTGAAIAAQLRGSDQVSVVTAGDGCSTSGLLHEACNHAAVWDLPVIFVCDNNQYMQSVGMDLSWGQPDISKIADAYGMPSEIVDGGDPLAVAEAARVAIERARSGGGPTFLEVKLIRWGPHYANEPDGLGYRDFTAIQEAREHDDPIINLENTLKDWGILTQADVDRVQREAVEEMDDAIRFAEESPSPTIEEAYTDIAIYA
jgi:pyruvate dehydrogenase E1 component alpha subunit